MNYTTKNIADAITQKIIDELEQYQADGTLPKWIKPWNSLESNNGQPFNPVTKNKYNGINWIWLSLLQGSEYGNNNQWVTYKQAQQLTGLDYPIQKGADSVQILFYKQLKVDQKDKDGKIVKNEDGTNLKTSIPMAKIYRVFNLDFVKESDKFKHAKPETVADITNKNERRKDIDAWIVKTKANINHGGNRAFYRPSTDSIHMPKIEDFKTTADYYATLSHELTHWTGGASRLDRKKSSAFKKFNDSQESYAFEELVAELGSAMLNAQHKIGGNLQHTEYIGSWIQALKNDNRHILKASALASKAVDYIDGLTKTA